MAKYMRLGELKAWIRFRDQRAVDACHLDRDILPSALIMWPDTFIPDLPRVASKRRPGNTVPVSRMTDEQQRPTIDKALRSADIAGYRLVGDEPKKIDVAYWHLRSVDNERTPVLFSVSEAKRLWPCTSHPPRRKGRPEEYDWKRIFEFVAEERCNAPSARQLEMIIQARCRRELGFPEGQPALSTIRLHLKNAQ